MKQMMLYELHDPVHDKYTEIRQYDETRFLLLRVPCGNWLHLIGMCQRVRADV